jgi:hypothetical protein
MANEFNIKTGFISMGDSRIIGGFSANTISATTYNVSQGLSTTTISATTYQNLPLDITVTGGTFSGSTAIFTNNTGGTFSVTGFTSGGGSVKEKRHYWEEPYSYCGTAPSGSLESDPVWTVSEIEVFPDGTTSTTVFTGVTWTSIIT